MRFGELWASSWSFRLGVLVAVLAAVMVLGSPWIFWRDYRTEAAGILGKGRVLEQRVHGTYGDDLDLRVEFVAADGTTHRVWFLHAGYGYACDGVQYGVGREVALFYDPSDPDRAVFTRTGTRGGWWLSSVLFFLGGLVAAILAFFLIRRAARIPPEAREWVEGSDPEHRFDL